MDPPRTRHIVGMCLRPEHHSHRVPGKGTLDDKRHRSDADNDDHRPKKTSRDVLDDVHGAPLASHTSRTRIGTTGCGT